MQRVRFWSLLDSELRAGRNVFAAFVTRHTLHSPGTTGARLLLTSAGEVVGTIGGGIMELDVIRRGRALVEETGAEPEIHHLYHRDRADGESSGMICAGEQTNLYCVFVPGRDQRTVAAIAAAADSDRRGVTSVGAFGLSFEEGGEIDGGRQFQLRHADSGHWEFREQVMNLKRVAVFGGGHCGLALSRALHQLGYDVILFDTREHVPTFADNVYVRSKSIVPDYSEAATLVKHPESTDAVVMTTDFWSDIAALAGLGRVSIFRSVGVMGSPAKIARIRKELRAQGLPEDFIASIRAPVGLPIHSNTPEEIAVSVSAQIVHDRNAEEAGRLQASAA